MPGQNVECPECETKNPSDSVFCNKCGTQFGPGNQDSVSFTKTMLTPGDELTKGNTLASRYDIVEELGKGGMGIVYKVFDTKIQEDVALKVLKPEVAAHKDTITRFSNELKFARRITHKNVCRMHDINEAAGTHFITMELVEGEDLKSVIKRMGKLKLGNVLSIALQVTDGLAEAHSLGIVHRDLKPQNIMIDKEGNAKIMDFGIARSEEHKGLTAEGIVIGTPDYMSPEQAEGIKTDQRSDIYSLGVILYEMVAGHVPFKGGSAFSVALKHKSEEPADPRQANPELPEGLARAILRCMEKESSRRYQNAGEFLSVLMAVQEMLPEQERVAQKILPRTAAARRERARLKRIFVPVLAAAAVVAAGILAWQLLSPTQPAAPPAPDRLRIAVLPFRNVSGDPQLDSIRELLLFLLTSSLRQSIYFSVVDDEKVIDVLNRMDLSEAKSISRENLEDIAKETRATHILKGTYIKLGDTFRVTADLQVAGTLESLASESEDGAGGDQALYSITDNLSKKLKPHLNLTDEQIAGDQGAGIANATSPIPRALEFYTEARKAMNNWDYNKAIKLLDNAVALDPDFALAYRKISGCYNVLALEVDFQNKDYWNNVSEYRKKALEASHRRPPTERVRLFIEASNSNDPLITLNTLHKLVELYPDDEDGNTMLAAMYGLQEFYESAKRYFEPLVRNNSGNEMVYRWLSTINRSQGLYEEAGKICEISLAKFPENPTSYEQLARLYIVERDFDNALSWCRKGYELNPTAFTDFGTTGHTHLFKADFPKAEEEYRKMLDSDSEQVRLDGTENLINLFKTQGRYDDILVLANKSLPIDKGRLQALAEAYMAKGDYDKALTQCEQMKSEWWRYWYFGELYTKKQTWEKAVELQSEFEKDLAEQLQYHFSQDLPEQIKDYIPKGLRRKKRLSLRLQGLIEIANGSSELAVVHLQEAVSLFNNLHDEDFAFVVEPLARAYFEKGDLDKAKEEYESIGEMTFGRMKSGGIYAKSFYMLGQICEKLGKKSEARKNYQRFLDLWKNADPDLPETADARVRLKALR